MVGATLAVGAAQATGVPFAWSRYGQSIDFGANIQQPQAPHRVLVLLLRLFERQHAERLTRFHQRNEPPAMLLCRGRGRSAGVDLDAVDPPPLEGDVGIGEQTEPRADVLACQVRSGHLAGRRKT